MPLALVFSSRPFKTSPRFILERENVLCVAEVVNRSLKADCTDFTYMYAFKDVDNMIHLKASRSLDQKSNSSSNSEKNEIFQDFQK